MYLGDDESIIIATDNNVPITSITAERINYDAEGIVLATDDNIHVTSIEVDSNKKDESDVLEFCNEENTETYAKIGVIDGSSGIFVNNIYDLNGNVLFKFDTLNDILILGGKKYKMIPYIEN